MKEIPTIINGELGDVLNSIEILVGLLGVIITALTLFGLLSYFGKKKILAELKGDMKQFEEKHTLMIDKKFQEESSHMKEEIQANLLKRVRSDTNKNQKYVQKEEYLRNIIFYDLNKILAHELDNGSNISDVYATYAERLFIIAQLTSGDRDKSLKALEKLSYGTQKVVIRLVSVKNYISYLKEQSEDIELLNVIDKFEISLLSNIG